MENKTPGDRFVEERGARKHQQVYPCGCVVSYCLCGCENAPEQRDCPTHAAAHDLLASLRALLSHEEAHLAKDNTQARAFQDSIMYDARAAISKAEGR